MSGCKAAGVDKPGPCERESEELRLLYNETSKTKNMGAAPNLY